MGAITGQVVLRMGVELGEDFNSNKLNYEKY